MKACPGCSAAIPVLRIARSRDGLICPGCGLRLCPDRRSQILMFGTLLAFFPLALYLGRRLPVHSFLVGFLGGIVFGMCAAAIGCLIYAWTVRLHTHHPGRFSEPRSWGGLV